MTAARKHAICGKCINQAPLASETLGLIANTDYVAIVVIDSVFYFLFFDSHLILSDTHSILIYICQQLSDRAWYTNHASTVVTKE